jgi:ABC-type branched-subunit amino acid transport system substrate-binding protein/Tfp pilus assembly protein PilF
MTRNKAPFFSKVIATLMVVMAFFILSCERKVIIREPPLKEPPPREPPEEKVVIDHFAIAEGYWRQKEYDKALAAYERYLEASPAGDKVREALTRKATIHYNQNQYEEALPLLLEVVNEYPLNEKRAEIHLLIARAYFHLKEYSESRLSALRWLELYKDYPRKEEIFYLLGQNLKELNHYPRVLYWWLKVLDSPLIEVEQKEDIRLQLLDLIYPATEEELKEMSTYAKESDLISPIYYQLALSYLESDKLDEARDTAIEIVRFEPEEELVIKANEVLQEIEERLKVSPNVIGCLLPLTGPFAIYGQEVLNGLELGLDIFQESSEGLSSIELVIRDTEGDPLTAIEALRELAEDEKAIVTIGPLISKVAEEVVEKAQELSIPIITLSQSEGITSKGEMVFQNCLTPEDQLRSLINKVMGEMGLKRFAILYPANAYGRYFMNKLWDKVESEGGMITAVESYNPEDTDFAREIKKMVGLFYPRPASDVVEEEPKPIIDFDAVFIPDSHERVALIASQLAFHDVVGVRLLGTNLWNSPQLIEIAGEYVHGALFPSGFFPGSGYIGVDSFVDQYKANFGQQPGLLAAMGYDTIRIVKEILRGEGRDIRTREGLRSALAENNDFDGVTGSMVFDDNRRAKRRDPLLLTVSGRYFLPMP